MLVPEGPVTHTHPAISEYDTRFFETKTSKVCATCNNGWMSDLEARAKPLLERMIIGRGASLGAHETTLLAAWAFKTALVFDLCKPDSPPMVPRRHYRHIAANHIPPRTARIDLSAVALHEHQEEITHPERDLRRVVMYRPTALQLQTRLGVRVNGYLATFHVAYLGVHVFGWSNDAEQFDFGGPGVEGMLSRVWPTAQAADAWPPRVALTPDGLVRMTEDVRG